MTSQQQVPHRPLLLLLLLLAAIIEAEQLCISTARQRHPLADSVQFSTARRVKRCCRLTGTVR